MSIKEITEDTTYGQINLIKAFYGITSMANYRYSTEVRAVITNSDGVYYGNGGTVAEAYNNAYQKMLADLGKRLVAAQADSSRIS
jgi:hypothetical protein